MITDFKIFESQSPLYNRGTKLLFVGKKGLDKGYQERVDANYFTVGKIYAIFTRDKRFARLIDDNTQFIWFDTGDGGPSHITNWFTKDKSWEEYEYRKNHEKFGI